MQESRELDLIDLILSFVATEDVHRQVTAGVAASALIVSLFLPKL